MNTQASAEVITDLVQTIAPLAPMQHLPAGLHWFAATTTMGQIHIGVEADSKSLNDDQTNQLDHNSVAGKAALLVKAEQMLQAMEYWQGLELDVSPANAPTDTSLVLRLQHLVASAPYPIYFVFEPAAFTQLSRFTEELSNAVDLSGLAVPHTVQLDSIAIPQNEYNTITEGALILLPASFSDSWVVQSYCFENVKRENIQLTINPSTQTLVGSEHVALSSVQAASVDTVQLNVTLTSPVQLSFASLLSFPVTPLEQAIRLSNADVTIAQNGKTLGSGTLCPVGRGFGVVVDTLGLNEA